MVFIKLSSRANVVKKFMAESYEFRNKLVFAPASLSGLVYCLWARPGAYPRVEHLFHFGRLLPYQQALHYPGKGHTHILFTKINYLLLAAKKPWESKY